MIWDILQAREYKNSTHRHSDSLHAMQVISLLIAPSSLHAGCFLALRYGLAMTAAGAVSVTKLARVTRLPKGTCEAILADMRDVIARTGGI